MPIPANLLPHYLYIPGSLWGNVPNGLKHELWDLATDIDTTDSSFIRLGYLEEHAAKVAALAGRLTTLRIFHGYQFTGGN